jgi:hypothetical protein
MRRTISALAAAAALTAAGAATPASASASVSRTWTAAPAVAASSSAADYVQVGSALLLVRTHRARSGRVRFCVDNLSPYRAQVVKSRLIDLDGRGLNRMGGGTIPGYGSYCAWSGQRFPLNTSIVSVRIVRHRDGKAVLSGSLVMPLRG